MTSENFPNTNAPLVHFVARPTWHRRLFCLRLGRNRSLVPATLRRNPSLVPKKLGRGPSLAPNGLRRNRSLAPNELARHRALVSYALERTKNDGGIEQVVMERLRRSIASRGVHRHSWLTRWRNNESNRNPLRRAATESSRNRQKPSATHLPLISCPPGRRHRSNPKRAIWTTSAVVSRRRSRFSEAFLPEKQHQSRGSRHASHV